MRKMNVEGCVFVFKVKINVVESPARFFCRRRHALRTWMSFTQNNKERSVEDLVFMYTHIKIKKSKYKIYTHMGL